jgi:NAD(P)-dependent dehydrogenase (short-subunit alcohol dehydrogenase family)
MGSSNAVLVTGAGGGVGSALTRALAERGFTVYAGVRSGAGEWADLPGVRVLTLDVTDGQSVAAAADTVRRAQGGEGLRAVVNNAGVIVQGPLELVPDDELRRQFEVNVFGPALVTRTFLPLLRAGGGRVVNVSAPTARVAFPYMGPIGASKAALESLSDASRIELAQWGVPVVVVQPSGMTTDIFAKAQAAEDESMLDADPETVRLYRPAMEAFRRASAKQKLDPVDDVVKTLVKAIETRRPDRMYVVGGVARQAAILSRLPSGLRDRLLVGALGLGKAAKA